MQLTHLHRQFNFSPAKEGRLVYMAKPSGGENLKFRERVWQGTKNKARRAWQVTRPARMGAWYLSGGGAVSGGWKVITGSFKAVGYGLSKGGEKVREGYHYGKGMGWEALKGAGEAGPWAFASAAMAIPRDIKINLWDVGRESLKTQWEAIKSPVNLARGVRQMLFGRPDDERSTGLFGRPLSIAKNLLTFQFRDALNDTLALRPVQLLRQAITLDYKGVIGTTRGFLTDVFAPLHRPVTPVFGQAMNIGREGIRSKTQYWDSVKTAREHMKAGWERIMNSPQAGQRSLADFRQELEEEKARIAREDAIANGEEPPEAATNDSNYAQKKKAV